MSDAKTTVEMQAPPDWAIALSEKVSQGFASVDSRLDALETNLDLQGGAVKDVGRRLTTLEERVGKIEDRQDTSSVRARSVTENDSKQDAAIAQLVTDVAELKETQKTQLAILQRLDKVAANPMVRRVAYAIGLAILGYLGARGIRVLP